MTNLIILWLKQTYLSFKIDKSNRFVLKWLNLSLFCSHMIQLSVLVKFRIGHKYNI